MKNFWKRSQQDTTPVEETAPTPPTTGCSICGKPALLTDPSPGVDPLEGPGLLRVNQAGNAARLDGSVTLPVSLRLCETCLEEIERFMAHLIRERGRAQWEETLLKRLAAINAGSVFTMPADEPRALPPDEVRAMLEETPFGGIWSNGV